MNATEKTVEQQIAFEQRRLDRYARHTSKASWLSDREKAKRIKRADAYLAKRTIEILSAE